MKKILESMEKGFFFAFGAFVFIGLAFGVYAFVEPSLGPSTDYYVDSNSPVFSNNTLQFVGYSGTTPGGFGGIKGGNEICDTAFEGSRVMTYIDFQRMSHLYNYTYDIWISFAVGSNYYPKDYFSTGAYVSGGVPARSSCYGFSTNSSSWTGPVLNTDGYLSSSNCAGSRRLACITGQ